MRIECRIESEVHGIEVLDEGKEQEVTFALPSGSKVTIPCRETDGGIAVTLRPGAPPVLVPWTAVETEGLLHGQPSTVEVRGQAVEVRVAAGARRAASRKPAASPATPARQPAGEAARVPGGVYPPMPGSVVKVLVVAGDSVQEGDLLLILEAMKMQNEVRAPRAGKVVRVLATPGGRVDRQSLLVEIEE